MANAAAPHPISDQPSVFHGSRFSIARSGHVQFRHPLGQSVSLMRRLDLSISRFLDLAIFLLVFGSLVLVLAELPAIASAIRPMRTLEPAGISVLAASLVLYSLAH